MKTLSAFKKKRHFSPSLQHYLSLPCLEAETTPRDSSFWSVLFIFPLSRCAELQRDFVRVYLLCPISYLSSLLQWKCFSSPTFLPVLSHSAIDFFCTTPFFSLPSCPYPSSSRSFPIFCVFLKTFHTHTHTPAESRSERPTLTAVSLSRLDLSSIINVAHALNNNSATNVCLHAF